VGGLKGAEPDDGGSRQVQLSASAILHDAAAQLIPCYAAEASSSAG
jgi:hypothetical protein